MATFLRTWSYRYPPLYDAISHVAAIAVGGEARFRQLAWEGIEVTKTTPVLDLCCGAGQATRFLVRKSERVTGLDISPVSLAAAQRRVPEAKFVRGRAESLPFAEGEFGLVHTSVALHEMGEDQRRQIEREALRVLRPGGTLALVDFHPPIWPLKPGLWAFLWLFETHTAWEMVATDLVAELEAVGFAAVRQTLHAGGGLQVIRARKAA